MPFGANLTGFTGQIAKGWQIAALGIFNSGSPLFINQDGDTLNVDSEEVRPNLVSGQDPTLPEDERTNARWFNTAAFARATTTYGTSPRNPLVGPGRKVVDVSISKVFSAADGTADPVPGGGLQRLQLGELEQSWRHARHDELRRDQRRRRGA